MPAHPKARPKKSYTAPMTTALRVRRAALLFLLLCACPAAALTVSPEEADARLFEEKLRRSLKEGAFLTLLVAQRSYQPALRELERAASRSRPSTPTG